MLALQELKQTDDKFPAAAFTEAGYQAQWFGQKTYNGVALVSQASRHRCGQKHPGFDDDMARLISASYPDVTGPGLRLMAAYFPNGQALDSDKFAYKMRWLKALQVWVGHEIQKYPKLVLLGDFNITFDAQDVWDPQTMEGGIHCSATEREQLQALLALGLCDSFRMFEQTGKSYTWWDYREQSFPRNHGLRIDHILISQALRHRASACHIDRTPRKNERPSDHAPVVLSLDA